MKRNFKEITVDNNTIRIEQIKNDVNGNPRIVVHFLDLGIDTDEYDNLNKLYGFTKYRGKSWGGGVVFQSYNHEETLRYAIEKVKEIKGGIQ